MAGGEDSALALVFILAFSIFCFADKDDDLVFGFALSPLISSTSVGGRGTADAREMFEKMADEFRRRYGYAVTLKIYQAPKFLFKAFHDNTVDFAGMGRDTYLYARKAGVPVRALFTTAFTDRRKDQWCVWVHKNSHIRSVKQLQGRNFATFYPMFNSKKDSLPPEESYIYWVMTAKILLKNGVDVSFSNFFKNFHVLPVQWESVAYAVLPKQFDAFHSTTSGLHLLKTYDSGFSELVPVSCLDIPALHAGVYRKSVNPEILKIFKTIIQSPDRSDMAKEIQKKFKGLQAVLVQEKSYDVYDRWLQEARQKGWIRQFNEIMKSTPKPKQKT